MYRPTADEQDLASRSGNAFACVERAADAAYHESQNEELVILTSEDRMFHELTEDAEALTASLMNDYEPKLVILEVLR